MCEALAYWRKAEARVSGLPNGGREDGVRRGHRDGQGWQDLQPR